MLADSAAIGIGAVAGALCRYEVGNFATRRIAEKPKRLDFLSGWHTCGINICGSLVLGFLAGVPTINPTATSNSNGDKLMKGISPRTRYCMGVGFCGSFTTFSTYSVDVVGFLGRGETLRAFSYIAANNIGAISAAYTGFKIARRICG